MRALVRCGQPALALTIWNHALTSGGVLPKQAVTQFLNICDEVCVDGLALLCISMPRGTT